MTKSDAEETFANQAQYAGLLEPECQYRFHPTRRWVFDFAWPACRIALEIEGGTWTQGRHTRGAGFEKDCEKYNEAALMGWAVFRVPTCWVYDGKALALLERAMGEPVRGS